MGPASHPIRAEVPDVAAAFANFDEITYEKGQAVLRQLVAYVGEDRFVEGLRAYFRDHAWGNTHPRRPDALRSAPRPAATWRPGRAPGSTGPAPTPISLVGDHVA